MAILCVGGMIGLGKTTVAELLAEALNSKVLYESVDDNPILPLFYTMTEEELRAQRIPFLLQLYFLATRNNSIREALTSENILIDRSIYEDWYFAKVNHKLGRINELEMGIYQQLLDSMLADLEAIPKKSPDLMIYLKASFETVLLRIGKRGRDFEQDEGLIEYYRELWKGYDNWVTKHYKASEVLIIDMDRIDVVKRSSDAQYVINQVKNKLSILN